MATVTNKPREALEAINRIDTRGLKYLLRALVEADIFDGGLINKTISAVEEVRCALSAPPRQCDIGAPEEQLRRFAGSPDSVKCDSVDVKCAYCALRWAQNPYSPDKGGAE